MKSVLLLLCTTATLLCSCGAHLTCNLHELVTPPDARVAMVDKMFPHRSMKSTDCFGEPVYVETGSWGQTPDEYLYQLNGVLYQKRTIQYAKANRPIIRRNDVPESPALTAAEMQEQFTIDHNIPEEVWMQPVWIDGKCPAHHVRTHQPPHRPHHQYNTATTAAANRPGLATRPITPHSISHHENKHYHYHHGSCSRHPQQLHPAQTHFPRRL